MVTEYKEICAICGRTPVEIHHMVYGRGLRDIADKNGLLIPLCRECHKFTHEHEVAGKWSKIAGQLAYEKNGSREDFRKAFGRSYL